MADTLKTLHQSMRDSIAAQFPEFKLVEFYREDRKGLPTPAILLDLSEMEHAEEFDLQTGQMPMDCRFEAEIILGFRQQDVKLQARVFAGAFATWLRMRRWEGVKDCGPARVIGAYKDEFRAEQDQFEVWRVEWQQVVHLGENEWDETGPVPTTLLASWVPHVGAAHAEDYVPVLQALENPEP